MTESQRQQALRDPLHLLAVGLGTGFAPLAPGTAGTLLAVPLAWFCGQLGLIWYVVVTLMITVFGIWLCGRTARWLESHDHPAIVIDEVAGYLITMSFFPKTWLWLGMGFIVFRVFDILKPMPIRWIDQHVHGGLGIMLDDVAAALYAALGLYIFRWAMG